MALTGTHRPDSPAPDPRPARTPEPAPELILCPVADDPDARPIAWPTVRLLRPYFG